MPFVTLNNEALTATIYNMTGTGDVTVTGSAFPFETSEDSSSDLLKPSRVSTGYIRIINERGNIDGIMGSTHNDRRVTLTGESGVIIWQGFVQPQQFGQDMYLDLDEIELPIVDALGVLDNVDMDYEDHEMQENTFGALIVESIMLLRSYNISINNVIFPKEWSKDGNYLGWARLAVNRKNWMSDNDAENADDADVERYSRPSYLKLLEHIAQQLGWTICIEGENIKLVSAAATDYALVDFGQLAAYASGSPVTSINYSLPSFSLTDVQSMGTKNTQTTQQGAKNIKIETKINEIKELKSDIQTDLLKFVRLREEILETEEHHTERALIYNTDQNRIKLHQYIVHQNESDDSVCYMTETIYDPWRDTVGISPQIAKVDCFKQTDVESGDKINYEYKKAIIIKHNVPTYIDPEDPSMTVKDAYYDPVVIAEIKCGSLPKLSNGCFDIDMEIDNPTGFDVPSQFIYFDLIVGDTVFSKNAFVKESHFEVTKTLSDPYEGASHFIIPINSQIEGDVTLKIYCHYLTTQYISTDIIISNISIKYCNVETESYIGLKSSSTYTAKSSYNTGSEEVNLSLSMATKTDNMKNGFGLLYYNGEFATPFTLQYKGQYLSTEHALLAKMRTAYFRTSKKITPTIKQDLSSMVVVGQRCVWNYINYIVLSRSINWRNSSCQLTLIEAI